jgi:hypothetical protein
MNPIVGPEMFFTIKYIQLNQQREDTTNIARIGNAVQYHS